MISTNLGTLFLQEKRELSHFRARVAIVFGVILVPLFYGLDNFIAPEHAKHFLLLRLIQTLESVAIFLTLCKLKDMSFKKVIFFSSLYFDSLAFMIAYMCRLLGGYGSTYYAGLVLVLIAMSVVMQWQLKHTIINSIIIFLSYLSIAYLPEFSAKDLANSSYFILATICITIYGSYWTDKFRFKEFLGRQEIKTANKQFHQTNYNLKT